MKFAVAQINCWVGNLEYNTKKILEAYQAYQDKVDLLIFPEMALSGYPIEDMVWNQDFMNKVGEYIERIVNATGTSKCGILFGAPIVQGRLFYNAALLVSEQKIMAHIYKSALPNYGVFDEKRTFAHGHNNHPIMFNGIKLGIMVCEDIWQPRIPSLLKEQNADVLIAINASPFEIGKQQKRLEVVRKVVADTALPLIYVNLIGGQDSLVFDGGSFALNNKGDFILPARNWCEDIFVFDLARYPCPPATIINPIENLYNAASLAIKDYVFKNGFSKVIIGLSGGIDSSLVAAIAVDALGSDNVIGIRLPSIYSSDHSLLDAIQLAENLGIQTETININELFDVSLDILSPFPAHHNDWENLARENLQSRIRGLLLMAFSNKFGYLLLTTGNKSEYAMGYATIYGDMCGGFAPIKDLYKTQVYMLADWRNLNIPENSMFKQTNIIPQHCITKPPSAELRPNQTDQDTLPPYEILDEVLCLLIEQNLPINEIIKRGFNPIMVQQVNNSLMRSEYKRNQSTLGPKVSTADFYKDRRYPITNFYKPTKI